VSIRIDSAWRRWCSVGAVMYKMEIEIEMVKMKAKAWVSSEGDFSAGPEYARSVSCSQS
jgi:hypothetical protein